MIAQQNSETLVRCPKCAAVMAGTGRTTLMPMTCGSCGSELEVAVFPAFFRGSDPVTVGERIQTDDEASCFYHPDKKAVVPCSNCGRFLCSLCEIPISGRRLCPACFELGKSKESMTELVTQRTLYDQIALSISVIPLLFFWVTLITAPMALYVAVRYWKRPTSILPRTKYRYVLAIMIALLQISGWAMFFINRLI